MTWSARTRAFLRGIFHRRQFEQDMQAELRFHIESCADDLVRKGMSREEALRRARIEFGAAEAKREECRASFGLRVWDELRGDVRYALRGLVRSPGFATTAVLTLALGIGATAAIFSVVNALLIRPLPYRDPARLLWITEQRPKMGDAPMLPDAVAWNQRSRLLESVAAYSDQPYTLTGLGEAARVPGAEVSPNFLATLGIAVQRGRDLAGSGNAKEALISSAFWRQRFGSDPRAVGSIMNLDDKPYVIVGILPQDFRFPDMALGPDVLVPLPTGPDIANPRMGIEFVNVIGRTRAARADLRAVQAELQSVHAGQLRTYDPWIREFSQGLVVGVTPLQVQLIGDARLPLLVLFAAIGVVLLIACANIANLQLVRTTARSHEVAVRSALGARRARLARQFLTESLTIALIAGAVGLLLAFLLIQAIRGLQLREIPWLETVTLDASVFLFTVAIAVTAALFFGVAPAFSTSRSGVVDALKSVSARMSSGRDHRWLRQAFVVGELALALVLLVGAGLLVRSFVGLMRADSGYDPENVISARVRLPMNRYHEYREMSAYGSGLLPRIQSLPGVRYAALSTAMPLQGYSRLVLVTFGPTPPPKSSRPASGPSSRVIAVTADFFAATGTPVVAGRSFTDDDNAQSIAVGIVNRAFARRYLDGNAVGKTVYSSAVGDCANCLHNGTFMGVKIVGMINDVRHDGLDQPVEPELYMPFSQMPSGSIHIVLKTASEPGVLASPLRSAVLSANPDVPAFEIDTLKHRLAESLARRRLTMFSLSSFAVLALLLAGIGVYGVISYAVLQRTREIGIRIALGATRTKVLELVMGQQLMLIAVGGGFGVALAFALSRTLQSLLFGVGARDATTFAFSWAVLTMVALLAGAVPAWRATRCDPNRALRYE